MRRLIKSVWTNQPKTSSGERALAQDAELEACQREVEALNFQQDGNLFSIVKKLSLYSETERVQQDENAQDYFERILLRLADKISKLDASEDLHGFSFELMKIGEMKSGEMKLPLSEKFKYYKRFLWMWIKKSQLGSLNQEEREQVKLFFSDNLKTRFTKQIQGGNTMRQPNKPGANSQAASSDQLPSGTRGILNILRYKSIGEPTPSRTHTEQEDVSPLDLEIPAAEIEPPKMAVLSTKEYLRKVAKDYWNVNHLENLTEVVDGVLKIKQDKIEEFFFSTVPEQNAEILTPKFVLFISPRSYEEACEVYKNLNPKQSGRPSLRSKIYFKAEGDSRLIKNFPINQKGDERKIDLEHCEDGTIALYGQKLLMFLNKYSIFNQRKEESEEAMSATPAARKMSAAFFQAPVNQAVVDLILEEDDSYQEKCRKEEEAKEQLAQLNLQIQKLREEKEATDKEVALRKQEKLQSLDKLQKLNEQGQQELAVLQASLRKVPSSSVFPSFSRVGSGLFSASSSPSHVRPAPSPAKEASASSAQGAKRGRKTGDISDEPSSGEHGSKKSFGK